MIQKIFSASVFSFFLLSIPFSTAGLSLSSSFSLAWPVALEDPWNDISSTFGTRVRLGKTDFHRGIDIRGEETDPILAAADGTIYRINRVTDPEGATYSGGNSIVISHILENPISFQGVLIDRYYTEYLHLSSIVDSLEEDQAIVQGKKIGMMGTTGDSTGVHLHFGVRLGTYCTIFSTCNTVGFDPAVHPMQFLSYPRDGEVGLRLRKKKNQLRVRVQTPLSRLNTNSMRVITFDQRGKVLQKRGMNFQTRAGFDLTSHDALDAMNTNELRVIPYGVGSTGDVHTVFFRYKKLFSKKTEKVRVIVKDAHGTVVAKKTVKKKNI